MLMILLFLIHLLNVSLTYSFSSTLSHSKFQRSSVSSIENRRSNENIRSLVYLKSTRTVRQNENGNKNVAYAQQTPHAGRHFVPTVELKERYKKNNKRIKKTRRFMEGWYYRLTLIEEQVSFAFIVSIEDPGIRSTDLTLAACQVMGPNDEYLIQGIHNDTRFWALKDSQALGCTFEFENQVEEIIGKINEEEWDEKVSSGFQFLPNSLKGKIVGHDGSNSFSSEDIIKSKEEGGGGVSGNCSWDYKIHPNYGWGGSLLHEQRSTAGWLASYPVFEPHWQVTLADARASGSVTWKNKTYHFKNQPFYAEKNWGGTFPTKWYWAQCNSFDNYYENNEQLSVTAGGGIRALPLGQTEEVGMIGIHYRNKFYEAVPWTGTFDWDVDPWGKWIFRGQCTTKGSSSQLFEAELIANCSAPGVVLRAPTLKNGLVYFCRDSFFANISLSLWPLQKTNGVLTRSLTPIIQNATSSQGAVEIGGGPWWTSWKGTSRMQGLLKLLLRFPYLVRRIKRRIRNDNLVE